MRFDKKIIQLTVLFLGIFLSLLSAYGIAATTQKPLDTEKAFILSTQFKDETLIASWKIAEGYYLYRDRFTFSFEPKVPISIQLPAGKVKSIDGVRTEVYDADISIPIKFQTQPQESLRMDVQYQGCSKTGFCYPPVTKSFSLNLKDQQISPINSIKPQNDFLAEESFPKLLTDQQQIQEFLSTHNLGFILILFVGLGLLLAFTPCVLPMVPILTSIIVGQQRTVTTRKAFFLSLSYVLGTALTYAIAGIFAAAAGSLLQVALQKPIVIASASIFFVLLSLSLFGVYELRMPVSFQNHIVLLSNKQKSGKYLGVFMMGVLSTLIISPCVTAPLVGVLLYISQTKDLFFGASALFALGLGMGLPLLLIGTSAGKWIPKTGHWMEAIKKTCGFAMIAMAIWMSSRIISQEFTYALWALLLFALALFLAFYLPRLIGKHFLNKSIGFLVALSASVLLLASVGVHNPWLGSNFDRNHAQFVVVRDVKDIDRELTLARSANQPVLIDFYADWCESCIVMDRKVFASPAVKPLLSNFKLLRVDLTNNTSADERLMQKFAVIAPPTIVYLDAKGREINSKRIVGEVNANEFLARIGANNTE